MNGSSMRLGKSCAPPHDRARRRSLRLRHHDRRAVCRAAHTDGSSRRGPEAERRSAAVRSGPGKILAAARAFRATRPARPRRRVRIPAAPRAQRPARRTRWARSRRRPAPAIHPQWRQVPRAAATRPERPVRSCHARQRSARRQMKTWKPSRSLVTTNNAIVSITSETVVAIAAPAEFRRSESG